jgi:hypothetical protein
MAHTARPVNPLARPRSSSGGGQMQETRDHGGPRAVSGPRSTTAPRGVAIANTMKYVAIASSADGRCREITAVFLVLAGEGDFCWELAFGARQEWPTSAFRK